MSSQFIQIQQVSKVFGKGSNAFSALDDVSFSIAEGADVAILGKSGSGKSTLMHAIAGLDRPTDGKIIIDGEDIWSLSKASLNKFRNNKMGFIFQTFYMQPNESVLANVMLPFEIAGTSKSKRKQLAMDALEQLDIDDKATNKARDLSGGQKQRVCIARAIAHSPKIIFADEPTGNLDSVTGAKVEDILFKLNKDTGSTLIVVTHDEDFASRFSGRVIVKDGRIEGLEGGCFGKKTIPGKVGRKNNKKKTAKVGVKK